MAPPTTTLQAPAGTFPGSYMGFDGISYPISSAGLVTIPNSILLPALAAGFTISSDLQPVLDAITAHAAGGQAAAVQLIAGINRMSVCATAGDSVKLPISQPGVDCVVINDGAASANVFGTLNDTINGAAALAAFAVPSGGVIVFYCNAVGAWQTSPSQIPLMTKFVLNAGAGPLVAAAGDLTGAGDVAAQYSGVNASTLTTRTAAQMIADAGYKVGQSYNVRILNSAAGTATLTAGAGVTLTGKVAIPTNSFVDYVVTVTGAATMTFQSIGSGTSP